MGESIGSTERPTEGGLYWLAFKAPNGELYWHGVRLLFNTDDLDDVYRVDVYFTGGYRNMTLDEVYEIPNCLGIWIRIPEPPPARWDGKGWVKA